MNTYFFYNTTFKVQSTFYVYYCECIEQSTWYQTIYISHIIVMKETTYFNCITNPDLLNEVNFLHRYSIGIMPNQKRTL